MGKINTSIASNNLSNFSFYINLEQSTNYTFPFDISTSVPGPIYARIKNTGAGTITISAIQIIFFMGQPGPGSDYTLTTISPNETKYFWVSSRYLPSEKVSWNTYTNIKIGGKTSIKKQNLSSLKPQTLYIYKSSDIKYLINVFQILVEGYNLNVYEGGINGQVKSFLSSGEGWYDVITEQNVDGYTIPLNSVIIFTGQNNVIVGNGAIIQNYNSGKINLFKSSIATPPSLVVTPLGIGFNVYSINSTSPGTPQTISYFGNPLDRIGYISNSLNNTNHYWTFTIANGYKIYFALDADGYSPSNIDSSIAIRSGNTWVESNILSQQNFGQNQQGQYILSSAHPYTAGTYTLRITNLTATTVNYTIRFIVNAI